MRVVTRVRMIRRAALPSKESALSSPKLSLIAIEKDGSVRVCTNGDLTAADFHPLGKNPLEAILGAKWSEARVLLDLSKTHFIDSAAIGWLISSHREFRSKGGMLAIHSIEPRVKRVLQILKVEQIFPLHADETAARSTLLRPAA